MLVQKLVEYIGHKIKQKFLIERLAFLETFSLHERE